MNYNQELLQRAKYIIQHGKQALENGKRNKYGTLEADFVKVSAFKSSGLSFILNLYGNGHPYYKEFESVLHTYRYESYINSGIGIINNIIAEIENGWINTIKSLVSAEIFNDFLEMAEHLLDTGYKDPAAVMVGSVLEEHLRQLCNKYDIDTTVEKDDKLIPLKADRLNSELAKANIFNKLDQKNITAQLDLRNNAAHGKYNEYDINHVKLMYGFVTNFISRNPL